MERYQIDKNYAVLAKTDSHGSQPKFHANGYWYKYDHFGSEGIAEELTSLVLSCSNITDYVSYERCLINEKEGCRSPDFLYYGEQFVTFQRLYQNVQGGQLIEKVNSIPETEDRFVYLVDFVREYTDLDATEYLYQNIALDMLISNPDRHFGNLGIILQENGRFRFAPIFDNGQGLRQNFSITPPYMDTEECRNELFAATISGSFEKQFLTAEKYSKTPFCINYSHLRDMLKTYPKTLAKTYLCEQLQRYEKLFSSDYVFRQENEITAEELNRD